MQERWAGVINSREWSHCQTGSDVRLHLTSFPAFSATYMTHRSCVFVCFCVCVCVKIHLCEWRNILGESICGALGFMDSLLPADVTKWRKAGRVSGGDAGGGRVLYGGEVQVSWRFIVNRHSHAQLSTARSDGFPETCALSLSLFLSFSLSLSLLECSP